MWLERAWFQPFVVGNESDFERYIHDIKQSGVWGDDIEIQAACEIYNRSAEIFAFDQAQGIQKLRDFHQQQDGRIPFRLSYFGGGHYDSIVCNRDWEQSQLKTAPGIFEREKLRQIQEAHRAIPASLAASSNRGSLLSQLPVPKGTSEDYDELLKQVLRFSDDEAVESSIISAQLQLSRRAFEADPLGHVDAAFEAGIAARLERQSSVPLESGMSAEEQQMLDAVKVESEMEAELQQALALSRQLQPEAHAAPPSTSQSQSVNQLYELAMSMTEEEQLQQLLAGDSKQTHSRLPPFSSAPFEVQEEDMLLAAAIEASLAQSPGNKRPKKDPL
jgi:hypothetical protein